jgi:hypothetical protein
MHWNSYFVCLDSSAAFRLRPDLIDFPNVHIRHSNSLAAYTASHQTTALLCISDERLRIT